MSRSDCSRSDTGTRNRYGSTDSIAVRCARSLAPPVVHEPPNRLIVGRRVLTTEPLFTQSSSKFREFEGEPQARRRLLNHGTSLLRPTIVNPAT